MERPFVQYEICKSLQRGNASILEYFSVNDIENMKISISYFFQNDDKLIEEFFQIHRLGNLDILVSVFLSAEQRDSNGVGINISSCNNFDNTYMIYM